MANEYNTRIGIVNHDPVCINMLYIEYRYNQNNF